MMIAGFILIPTNDVAMVAGAGAAASIKSKSNL